MVASGQESSFPSGQATDRPTAIRIVCSTGLSGGKPLLANTLTTACQQRALEEEFRADGIRIDWSFIGNKRTRMGLYARNEADFTNLGPVDTVAVRAAGYDYKVIMALRHFDAVVRLAVRSDSSVRAVADLKGGRITTIPNHFYQLTLFRILEKHGLQPGDFTFAPGPDIASTEAAVAVGSADACLVDLETPFVATAQARHRTIGDITPDPAFAGVGKFCVSGKFERQHPELVQRVVATLVRVAAGLPDEENQGAVLTDWAISNEHRAVLNQTYAGRSLRECMSPLMDDFFLAGLRRDCDDTQRFGMVATSADLRFEAWVDSSYLRKALATLGLEGCWARHDGFGAVSAFPRADGD